MEILKLNKLDQDVILDWGHNGYKTNGVYEVTKTMHPGSFQFMLQKMEKEYLKTWTVNAEDITRFNEIISARHSYRALDKGKIIGFILAVNRKWNNTLYIENLLVSEFHRGQGAGHLLINQIKQDARVSGFRLIELETQNTNVPAHEFYLKQGFEITGMNLKLYVEDVENEIALYMTYDLR